MNEMPKEIMKEIVELRKKKIELHEKYCKIIIEKEPFKHLQNWEKQHMIDVFSGVQFGSNIGILEDNLQLSSSQIKNYFRESGIELNIEKNLWQQE